MPAGDSLYRHSGFGALTGEVKHVHCGWFWAANVTIKYNRLKIACTLIVRSQADGDTKYPQCTSFDAWIPTRVYSVNIKIQLTEQPHPPYSVHMQGILHTYKLFTNQRIV